MSRQMLGLLLIQSVLAGPGLAADRREIDLDLHQFQFSPEIVIDPKDGTVRLARSSLTTRETGATDFHQAETLSDRAWVKATLPLSLMASWKPVTKIDLLFFGSAEQVHFNDTRLTDVQPVPSTGWKRVKIPPSLLRSKRDGQASRYDEVVLSGKGTILWEPGRGTASSKSTDGGNTWAEGRLGNGSERGDYLIRVRTDSSPPRGSLTSPVLDLWDAPSIGFPRPGRIKAFRSFSLQWFGRPLGETVLAELRTGSTPTPDSESWTSWIDVESGNERLDAVTSRHRWAQVRLAIIARPGKEASVGLTTSLKLAFDAEPDEAEVKDLLDAIWPGRQGPISATSVPFVYEKPSPRLKLLRERYQLDKVIAPGKTEMEQLLLLRHWVRNQWHTAWGSHPAAWMPPWDSLIILASKDQPDCLTMCTHYACVFTQCCLALGWNARHCILDHHCVAEVWVDQHQKWVMMDAGNSPQRADVNLHFERNGVPMSALELHLPHRTGKTDGIQVCFTPSRLMEQIASLCRPEPPSKEKRSTRRDVIPLAELKKYPVCQLENYRRYAFPGRNNYLTSLLPGELYQGWSEYFYDGYWWVGDSPDDPQLSPEYSRHLTPSRPQDIDWSLNWTRIHLCRTDKPGEVRVDLETGAPNFARFERRANETAAWQAAPGSFAWKLEPGKNTLRVRSVNQWDRAGADASVQVEWKPAGNP